MTVNKTRNIIFADLSFPICISCGHSGDRHFQILIQTHKFMRSSIERKRGGEESIRKKGIEKERKDDKKRSE